MLVQGLSSILTAFRDLCLGPRVWDLGFRVVYRIHCRTRLFAVGLVQSLPGVLTDGEALNPKP